ncbi:ATP-binding cassette domain-containing protein [Aquirufa ecclesiirivi]|uniref:ATP-binding cassette domain-containing protein n=1 Tax=Aquirufa ecclesiirivi TaxID=2715124 RepID=UPI0022A83B46|nr:ABC transporter ATP-binding protein [Aquirufa ecclesiirivi]MCZ2472099.1 ABC transporter ATP-binding protein [Aquirufa ecclesiirivi]MDF0693807.1 ABC transporter ATP-binding protein [Aquirufa ecclesiirivi]
MLEIQINHHQVTSHFALNHIHFQVKAGEIFALIGKSGSGKSTIANIVVGQTIQPEASIQVNGKELNTQMDRLIKVFKEVGYVPQNLHLMPHHTVEEYLRRLGQKMTAKDLEKFIRRNLIRFRLKSVKNTKIQHLSGGERQKLALLEAISKPIEILVLDEPFSQLDTEQKLEFSEIFKQVVEEEKIPCLLISHDLVDILSLSQQVGILHQGKLIFQGDWNHFKKSKNKHVATLQQAMLIWKEKIDALFKV